MKNPIISAGTIVAFLLGMIAMSVINYSTQKNREREADATVSIAR